MVAVLLLRGLRDTAGVGPPQERPVGVSEGWVDAGELVTWSERV